jgi:Ca2+-transporting ATPase
MLTPGLKNLLGIVPVSLIDGIVIGGSAVLPLLINEGTKRPSPHSRENRVKGI